MELNKYLVKYKTKKLGIFDEGIIIKAENLEDAKVLAKYRVVVDTNGEFEVHSVVKTK